MVLVSPSFGFATNFTQRWTVTVRESFRSPALQVSLNVGLIFCLVVWLHGGIFIPSGDPSRDAVTKPRADFMIFYGAGLLVKTAASQLYDIDRQGAAQKAATGLEISGRDIDFLPYPYPPILALAMIPFTLVNYMTAYQLMIVINFLMLGLCIGLISSRLALSREASQILVLCATASLSVYSTLIEGQVSFLILLFYILVITNLRAGQEVRAGLWAGCLAFKPTLLPIWLFWFAIRGRWRAFGCACAIGATMATVSILTVGIEGVYGYLSLSRQMLNDSFPTARPHDMAVLRAVTYFFALPDSVWLVMVGCLLLVLWRAKLPGDWEYCMVVVVSMLTAPYLQLHETVLLLVVVALFLLHTGTSRTAALGLIGFSLWQAIARFAFAGTFGSHLPVMPMTLIIVLGYIVYRARSAEHMVSAARTVRT
jgi:alpha-1,2-mannosyltransferase